MKINSFNDIYEFSPKFISNRRVSKTGKFTLIIFHIGIVKNNICSAKMLFF